MARRPKNEITYKDKFRLFNGLYESFVIYNPVDKKNQRVRLANPTASLEEANSFRRQTEIKFGITQIRAEKRFLFLQKFNNQEVLFDEYTKHRQKVAKRSWKEDVSRMNNYVFPFFIGQMNLNHPSQWFEYWKEFQASLGKPMRKNTKGKTLTVNSKDNIIRCANSFISFVELEENGSPIKRLPEFKYEEKGRRGVESVYTDTEIENIYKALEKKDIRYAILWNVISNTGMRVGETISLLTKDVVLGAVPSQEKWIFNSLKDKTPIYGYILLKSQCADINKLVSDDGTVTRVPLKKRKIIAPEHNRIIPLINLEMSKRLQQLKKDCKSKHELLFESCTYREFYTIFDVIRKELKLTKDIHSLRHTFATKFTKLCDGDPRIAEKVLGHSDAKMTQRYNHLANELESMNVEEVFSEIKAIKF